MDKDDGDIRKFSDQLVAELKVCRGLLVLAVHDAGLPVHNRAYCSDASEEGYALHATDCSRDETLSAVQWRERWRFQPAPILPNDEGDLVSPGADAGLRSLSPSFDGWVDDQIAGHDSVRHGVILGDQQKGGSCRDDDRRQYVERVGMADGNPQQGGQSGASGSQERKQIFGRISKDHPFIGGQSC
eukprot:8971788-Karenia_brevis.AAC.1